MGKVAAVLKEAADYLVARTEPLNFTGRVAAAQTRRSSVGHARRVATGIVPDMTYQGEGVRVGSVQPGSGADNAGIKPGDRLLGLGGVKNTQSESVGGCAQGLATGANGGRRFARDAAILSSTLLLSER